MIASARARKTWSQPAAAELVNDWLSNLAATVPLADLVDLAKIRWRIEHDYSS